MLEEGGKPISLAQGFRHPIGSQGQRHRVSLRISLSKILQAIERQQWQGKTVRQHRQETIGNPRTQRVMNQNMPPGVQPCQSSGHCIPPVMPGTKERKHGDLLAFSPETLTDGRSIDAGMGTWPEQERNQPGAGSRAGCRSFGRQHFKLNR